MKMRGKKWEKGGDNLIREELSCSVEMFLLAFEV